LRSATIIDTELAPMCKALSRVIGEVDFFSGFRVRGISE